MASTGCCSCCSAAFAQLLLLLLLLQSLALDAPANAVPSRFLLLLLLLLLFLRQLSQLLASAPTAKVPTASHQMHDAIRTPPASLSNFPRHAVVVF